MQVLYDREGHLRERIPFMKCLKLSGQLVQFTLHMYKPGISRRSVLNYRISPQNVVNNFKFFHIFSFFFSLLFGIFILLGILALKEVRNITKEVQFPGILDI